MLQTKTDSEAVILIHMICILFQLTFFQLDEQVRQFVAKLQERSLVTVVMTGRYSEGQHLNAATFVKIT